MKWLRRCGQFLASSVGALAISVLFHGTAFALDDAAIVALRQELAALKSRIAVLEARLADDAGQPVAEPARTPAPAAPLPERAPTVTVGGRVKLDVIGNSHSADGGSSNRADVALLPSAIPISGNGEDDQVKFSARNSRLWVKALTPSELGDFAAYIELDFFSSSGAGDESVTSGYVPRLRHGYGQWRGWLGGQTYSTAIDLAAYPEINDDGAPLGVMLVRQPMVRWSHDWGEHGLALALESPDSLVRSRDGRRLAPDDERLPDFALRYEQRHRWGHWSLGALAREIRIDQTGADDTAFGGAVTLSGKRRFGERDDVRVMLSGGNAIGRYLSAGIFDDARLDSGGDLELVTAAGGYVAYRHWWAPRWRSNLLIGAAWMDDDGAVGEENERAYSVHVNLLWSPILTTSIGLEWIHAERERVDGRDGTLDRLQFTAIHKF